jgi:hypothetical protein
MHCYICLKAIPFELVKPKEMICGDCPTLFDDRIKLKYDLPKCRCCGSAKHSAIKCVEFSQMLWMEYTCPVVDKSQPPWETFFGDRHRGKFRPDVNKLVKLYGYALKDIEEAFRDINLHGWGKWHPEESHKLGKEARELCENERLTWTFKRANLSTIEVDDFVTEIDPIDA